MERIKEFVQAWGPTVLCLLACLLLAYILWDQQHSRITARQVAPPPGIRGLNPADAPPSLCPRHRWLRPTPQPAGDGV